MIPTPNTSARKPWSFGRVVACILAGVIGCLVFSFFGLVGGAIVGGNLATGFQFAGQRGYEATGILGALIGAIAGGPLSAYLVARLTNR